MDRFASIATFVAAVEEGSLVAAGRRFGLSASMAGKHLSSLEADLNVRLLQRSTRRLSLTEAGKTYYAKCKRILEELDEADREASDAQGTLTGSLKVAAPLAFGELHLSAIVTDFLQAHPQLKMDISLDDRYVDLQSESIDVAIRIGRLADSQLVARRLAPCRMVACASPAFLDRAGTPRTPEDLRAAPRLVFSEDVSLKGWVVTDQENRPHVIDGPQRMHANSMHMLLAATLAGSGIAYGPSFVFGPHIKAGTLVALLPGYRFPELTIYAVYPTARYVPSKVRHFIEWMAAALGDRPAWDP